MTERLKGTVHLIGIGGAGLSAIARVLLESGYQVSGSDRQASASTRALEEAGAKIFIGHAPENIGMVDLVIRSSAIPEDNPEVLAARQKGIPVLKRADFLGQWMREKVGIAIAGSHGKTTTTAMVSWIFSALGLEPGFIVGGVMRNLGVNAHAGRSNYFIIEADEYDQMFHGLEPSIAVVTNIEHDHPDCYPTSDDFYRAFLEFTQKIVPDGHLILCIDDPGAARLAQEVRLDLRLHTYGVENREAQVQAYDWISLPDGDHDFTVRFHGQEYRVHLKVPGMHNVRNALAALLVADCCGLSLSAAVQALASFSGVGRRFDVQGEARGVTVIDDYGHHPTEIRSTLAAARARYPGRRIWAVWQPHTYSRTRLLEAEFGRAFANADEVLVTEIFASREQPPADGYSASRAVKAIQHPRVVFIPHLEQAGQHLIAQVRPGDVVIVFSAGDADQISRQLIRALQNEIQLAGPTSLEAKE